MNESILISIKSKYCELIAVGKKKLEIRKSYPKDIKYPFKVYIYCTIAHPNIGKRVKPIEGTDNIEDGKDVIKLNGKVIGEFICDKVFLYRNGSNLHKSTKVNELCQAACVERSELFNYAPNGEVYAWNITNFKLYDRPKYLRDFRYAISESIIKSAPQSWCYVKEGDDSDVKY